MIDRIDKIDKIDKVDIIDEIDEFIWQNRQDFQDRQIQLKNPTDLQYRKNRLYRQKICRGVR